MKFNQLNPIFLKSLSINLRCFIAKEKKFLPLNKDIADEGGDFAIFNLFEEEEKIFEKLNKKEQKVFQLLKIKKWL